MKVKDKETYDSIRDSISMDNLKQLINTKDYKIAKVSTNTSVTEATIFAYMNGTKIPSLTSLISLSEFFDNVNLDFLIGRTNNPMSVKDFDKISNNTELNILIKEINSLPKEKQKLIIEVIKTIINN